MANRTHQFVAGEHYHCFNRGVDKRTIFSDQQDYVYFLKLLRHLNTDEVLGKLRLQEAKVSKDPPVTLLTYCLLPNHYHILLRCNTDKGVSQYMKRVGVGYTMYFNQKHKRSGSLFQGTFKSKHIDSDQDLRQVLAYVHLNYKVHNITDTRLYRTSLNVDDELVRGFTSNYGDTAQNEAIEIIKELRQGFD